MLPSIYITIASEALTSLNVSKNMLDMSGDGVVDEYGDGVVDASGMIVLADAIGKHQ